MPRALARDVYFIILAQYQLKVTQKKRPRLFALENS